MRKAHKEEAVLKVSISTGTMLKALLLPLIIFGLYLLKDVFVILFLAWIISLIIDPLAVKFEKVKVPRGFAVLIVYLLMIAAVAGVMILIFPPVFEQAQVFVENYSFLLNDLTGGGFNWKNLSDLEFVGNDFAATVQAFKDAGITDSLFNLLMSLLNVFGGFLATVLVLILGYYFVIEEKSILQGVKLFTPRKYQKFILNFLQEAKIKVGYWLRGQLLIMIIIGLLDYLALLILGVPFALLLGVLGGILEIVPYLGPNLAALPAVLLAFSISPALAALVILAYFLIQQFEADFLTPKVMQKVAGLNPIISIVAIMVGYKLLGIAGGLLAIPTTVLLILFIKHWLAFRNKI